MKMNQLLKNRIITSCWIAAGVVTIVLLGAASRIKSHHACVGINVEIKNVDQESFIEKDDVIELVNINGSVIGKEINTINLFALENVIKQNHWIRDVQLFFDKQNVLEVSVKQREPKARVFCVDNQSFYIDAFANRLPLTGKASARVLVITGFTSNKDTLSSPDSVLLKNTVKLVNKITSDSFWNAQIAQVNITPKATFELVPAMGNHLVEFGAADSIDSKLRKLKAFYKNVFYAKDMSAYTRLNVEYDNQVVASKTAANYTADSIAVIRDTTASNTPVVSMAKDSVDKKKATVADNAPKKEQKLSVVKQNKQTDIPLSSIGSSINKKENIKKPQVPKAVMNKNN
jgi:cell division protein FtsQ